MSTNEKNSGIIARHSSKAWTTTKNKSHTKVCLAVLQQRLGQAWLHRAHPHLPYSIYLISFIKI